MSRRRPRTWSEYVRSVIDPNERQVDIARRSGIDQTTLSRWLNGDTRAITSLSVAKFARAYQRPVLEAFVVAGFLTASEAGVTTSSLVDWTRVSNAELLHELQKRIESHELDGELSDA